MSISFLKYHPDRISQYATIGKGDENNWSMGAQEGLFLLGLLTAIRARRVVEVGTNIGHSALYISHALKAVSYPDALLHSFEISDRAKVARDHLRKFGYDSFAFVHQCNSRGPEAEQIRDAIAPLDAVLIDGDHSYEGSYADFVFWEPAVRPGGLIVFHDISREFEEIYERSGLKAVYSTVERIAREHPDYEILRLLPPHYHNTTSMGVVQKSHSAPAPKVQVRMPAQDELAAAAAWKATAGDPRLRERPWEEIPFPPTAKLGPSMLQIDELRYLYWLARDGVPQTGQIVELGPWQGGSTGALAQGLRDRAVKTPNVKVHAFDRFVWDTYASQFSPDLALKVGDDMTSVFQKHTKAWEDLIQVHKGEIENAAWDPAQPISLLFVDAPSTPTVLQAAWNIFGPALRPGSIVVFQDYKHWSASFLPAAVAQLHGLKPVHVCRDGCSVAFEVVGEFKPAAFGPLARPSVDLAYKTACETFAFDPPTAAALEFAWLTQLAELGFTFEAKERYERLRGVPVCAGAADAPHALRVRLGA